VLEVESVNHSHNDREDFAIASVKPGLLRLGNSFAAGGQVSAFLVESSRFIKA
jgi:hypothetical protein